MKLNYMKLESGKKIRRDVWYAPDRYLSVPDGIGRSEVFLEDENGDQVLLSVDDLMATDWSYYIPLTEVGDGTVVEADGRNYLIVGGNKYRIDSLPTSGPVKSAKVKYLQPKTS
jgi:hypothetical protein